MSQPLRILVTGITGRIGANVARHFLAAGHQVRGLVWPGDRQSEKLAQLGADIVEGDLASSADVAAAASDQQAILHLGAAFQAGGPFSPQQYFDTNIKGTFNVLEAALSLGDSLRHVIVSSTDATMDKYPPDGIGEPLQIDSLPLDSTAWYGYSKIATEHLVDRYVRGEQLPATVFRYSFVWGAGEMLAFAPFHLKSFIDQLSSRTDVEARNVHAEMLQAYGGEPHLVVACDRNGRPWKKHALEVREIVHAHDRALAHANTYGKVYQLGSLQPVTWDVIVPYMAEQLGAPFSRFDLPVTPTFYEHDLTPAITDFGYDPPYTTRDMVDDAIRYARDGGSDIIPTAVAN